MAVWAVMAVSMLVVAGPATTPTDPLGCDAVVFDPGGQLETEAVTREATRAASVLGADVHVRAEAPLDSGLDARMAQLEAQCPGWRSGGERADDLVVIMYSASEREASVFYGAGQADALEARWEPAVDAMGADFADGDFTSGVLAGLGALQEGPARPIPAAADRGDDSSSSPGSGIPPAIWILVIALVVVAFARVVRFGGEGGWTTDGDESGGSSWGSSRRASTWASSSRSSSRSSSWSSRSSRSSSSSSSRRAGGGTKKW